MVLKREGDYPTPAQVSVFAGNIWLDDAYRVEVRHQNPIIPLYGHTEKDFSATAQGKRVVTGSLVINYRYPGYLYQAIRANRDGEARGVKVDHAVSLAHAMLNSSIAERIKLLEQARQLGIGRDVGEIYGERYNPPGDREEQGSRIPSVTDLGHRDKVEIRIFFDLPARANYVRIVKGVRFTGQSMVISNAASSGGDSSASGMPLYEIYSFIGHSIESRKQTPWQRDLTDYRPYRTGQELLNSQTPIDKSEGSGSGM